MRPNDPDEPPTNPGQPQPEGSDPAEARTTPSLGDDRPAGVPGAPDGGGKSEGKPPAKGKDKLLGVVLGGCRIDALLGGGAMGAVYRARQLKLDRDVAVKIIRREMMADPRMLKRFEVEARTVGRFQSQHVVMVHDVGVERGVHFLVMEFVPGKNLRDHVKLLAGGRLPTGEALPLLRQACKGLEEAQRLGVVHRDIKPDNLMLTDRGVLKIADFGIAKPMHEDFNMTLTSELIGTPLYMSPEQCQGRAGVDFRSDMYSLGATFYYLLTGEPPVRASSVYELIQTKTKLENLCLWKALPELGENHPLSRVIERMPALNRDVGLGSYVGLLAFLVLVDPGGTLAATRWRAPRADAAGATSTQAMPAPGGRRGLWLGAAALALAATGLLLWQPWRGSAPDGVLPQRTDGGAANGPTTGTTTRPGIDRAAVAAALAALRTRLRDDGPSEILRHDVAAVAAEGADAAERDALRADVERGLPVVQRLAAITLPSDLAAIGGDTPFADLERHLLGVETAVAVDGAPGAELRAWLQRQRQAARGERELGALALGKLVAAFSAWQTDRGKVTNDARQLAELGTRLDGIEAARRRLAELLPAVGDGLQRDVPLEGLERARRGLVVSSSPVVDVRAVLDEIAAEFAANGPNASIAERTRGLQPTAADQLTQRDALLDAMQRADRARSQAQSVHTSALPTAPRLPFDDVTDYWAALDRALDPLVPAGGALPQWAIAERDALRETARLQPLCVDACRRAWRQWQDRRRGASSGDPAALGEELKAVGRGIARARELFPAAAAELAAIASDEALATADQDLAAMARGEQLLAAVRATQREVAGVATLAGWRAVAQRVTATLEQQGREAATDAALQGEFERARAAASRWQAADRSFAALCAQLAAGDLTAADAAVRLGAPASEGRTELETLAQVVRGCRDAFTRLGDTLAIDDAEKLVGQARTTLQSVAALAPAVDAQLATWLQALAELRRRTVGMVPIAAGATRAASGRVPAFFLSATEVSHGEFTQFVAELRTAVSAAADGGGDVAMAGDGLAKAYAKVAAKFDGTGFRPTDLAALLAREPRRVDGKLPEERVLWCDAAACAAWSGRKLPTVGEWALAAFGDGNRYAFPWGATWSNDAACRNPSNTAMVEVDAGGLSWRSADGIRLHHLAGNVAEWLAAPADANEAPVAGGCYADRDASARDHAGGEIETLDKTDGRRGVGFRTALHLADVPGLSWK